MRSQRSGGTVLLLGKQKKNDGLYSALPQRSANAETVVNSSVCLLTLKHEVGHHSAPLRIRALVIDEHDLDHLPIAERVEFEDIYILLEVEPTDSGKRSIQRMHAPLEPALYSCSGQDRAS